MVDEGVEFKTAQTRLGHSDPRLTLAVYAQATTEADRAVAGHLGERFMPTHRTAARDGRARKPTDATEGRREAPRPFVILSRDGGI